MDFKIEISCQIRENSSEEKILEICLLHRTYNPKETPIMHISRMVG